MGGGKGEGGMEERVWMGDGMVWDMLFTKEHLKPALLQSHQPILIRRRGKSRDVAYLLLSNSYAHTMSKKKEIHNKQPQKKNSNTYRSNPHASFRFETTSAMMVSANTPAAMAPMRACRLLPLPDIRMTSLEGMVFFVVC